MRIAIVALIGLLSAAQTPAPAPAPSTFASDADLMAALKTAALTAPDMHTAPVKNTDHYASSAPWSTGIKNRLPSALGAYPER